MNESDRIQKPEVRRRGAKAHDEEGRSSWRPITTPKGLNMGSRGQRPRKQARGSNPPNPGGVQFAAGGSTLSGSVESNRGAWDPWVSPTATHVVPLRGTNNSPRRGRTLVVAQAGGGICFLAPEASGAEAQGVLWTAVFGTVETVPFRTLRPALGGEPRRGPKGIAGGNAPGNKRGIKSPEPWRGSIRRRGFDPFRVAGISLRRLRSVGYTHGYPRCSPSGKAQMPTTRKGARRGYRSGPVLPGNNPREPTKPHHDGAFLVLDILRRGA